MRKLIWPVLFLLLLVIQGAVTVFYTGWPAFDLLLVFLYVFTIINGKYWGAAAGVIIGFFQDGLTLGMFGFHMLTRTVFAYVMGSVYKNIYNGNMAYHVGMMGLSTLVIQSCYCLVELVAGGWQWRALPSLLWQALGQSVGNGILVLPVLFLGMLVQKWVTQKDITYNLDSKHESAKRDN